jgi:hypothetical protein
MSNIYAIVNNNTIIATGRAKALWPQMSFADSGPREDWLIEQGAQPIRYDPPYDPDTHQLQPSAPYLLDGVVYAREAVSKPEPELQPEWIAFQRDVMSTPAVNIMLGATLQAAPAVGLALAVGLGQVAQGGDARTFLEAWGAGMVLGLITAELTAVVSTLAVARDLPADFVAALAPPEAL